MKAPLPPVWTHDLPLTDVGSHQKRTWTNGRKNAWRCRERNFLFGEKPAQHIYELV